MKALALVMVGALASVGAGCGSDTSCGDGTVKMNGACVPAGDSCGTGTALVDGVCVPDGTVVCETGTTFDETTGTCVPDITGCGTGTVLVGGECVPEDQTPTADVTEPAEPNGFEAGATLTTVPLPAEGDDVIISGCIEPRPDYDLDDNVDADYDVYQLTVTEPTLLDVTVDGVGGMAGGFRVLSTAFDLNKQRWARSGLNLVGDTASRQVLLPKAGDYLLVIADSRSLLLGDGFGDGTNTCYYATVGHVAMPSPTAVSGSEITGTLTSDAQFYTLDPSDGDHVRARIRLLTQSPAITSSLIMYADGEYLWSDTLPGEVFIQSMALVSGEPLTIVVEQGMSYQLQPVEFSVGLDITPNSPASTSPTTIAVQPGFSGTQGYFDADAGDILRVTFDDLGNGDPNFDVYAMTRGGSFAGIALNDANAGTGYVQLMEAGRYALRVRNTNIGATAPVDVEIGYGLEQASSITVGTPVTGVALGASGASFFELELTDSDWLSISLSASGFGGTASYYLLPRETGEVEPAIGPFTGDEEVVLGGVTGTFLVVVADSDVGSASSPTFDLSIGEATIDDRGTVRESAPVDLNGVSLPANGALHYMFDIVEHTDLAASAVGSGLDLIVELRDAAGLVDTADDGGAGVAETATASTNRWSGLFGVTIREASGAAGTVDVDLVPTEPSYLRSEGRVNPDNLCFTGDVVDVTGGVSAVQSIGFTFPFFGEDKTELVISERGFLTFNTSFTGGSLPLDAAGPTLAGQWSDVDVCMEKASDHLAVQWRGLIGDTRVKFQLILWQDGRVENRYSPGSDYYRPFPTLRSSSGELIEYQGPDSRSLQVVYTPN